MSERVLALSNKIKVDYVCNGIANPVVAMLRGRCLGACLVLALNHAGSQQHFQAPVYDKDTKSHIHTQSIGLSQRHKDQHIKEAHKPRGISRQQRALEKSHAKYPFSGKVLWLSVLAFVAVVLASLYWVVYLSYPQA